ncbi:MAG: apolipoprotein N-acyltransferase [Planctomycetota bacterium]
MLLTGAAHALASPPYGWAWIHPFLWVPALLVFARVRGRRALLAGWLAGAAANAAVLSWMPTTITTFSNLPASAAIAIHVAACLVWGLFAAVFAWGFGAVRRACGGAWPFGLAAWFTACEFLSPQVFPWYQGVTLHAVPTLFLVTSLTGVAGLTFLLILANGIVLQAIETLRGASPKRALVRNAAGAAMLVLLAGVWSQVRLGQIERAEGEARSVRIALVQSNHDPDRVAELTRRGPDAIARDLIQVSERALREHGRIDVFVWPEAALKRGPEDPVHQRVLRFARRHAVEVWTGAQHYEMDRAKVRRRFNCGFRVDARGRVDGRYDKNMLVPFGEFMPLAGTLPALARIEGPVRITAGEEQTLVASPSARFVFLICYEAIHADFVRRNVRLGPDLLVNLTYDGWFGDTAEPHQHLMLAAIQSAQFGVPLVRATTTGISAFVDARGVVTARTELGQREVLVRDVKLAAVSSPYATLGDWFGWSCVALSVFLLLRAWRLRCAATVPSAMPLRGAFL